MRLTLQLRFQISLDEQKSGLFDQPAASADPML